VDERRRKEGRRRKGLNGEAGACLCSGGLGSFIVSHVDFSRFVPFFSSYLSFISQHLLQTYKNKQHKHHKREREKNTVQFKKGVVQKV